MSVKAAFSFTQRIGGQTWQRLETGTQNNLHDVFIAEMTGWIVGDWGTLLKTTDSGQTFTKVDGSAFGRKSLRGVHFVDNTYGWVVTYNTPEDSENAGYIYHTNDGGQTWEVQFSTQPALFSVHFVDRMTGWVVGDGAQSFRDYRWRKKRGNSSRRAVINGIKRVTGNQNTSEMKRCTRLRSTILTSQMCSTAGLWAT